MENPKLTKQQKLVIKQQKLMDKSFYVNSVKEFQQSRHSIQPSLEKEDFWVKAPTTEIRDANYETYIAHLQGFTDVTKACLFGQEMLDSGEVVLANKHPFDDLLQPYVFANEAQHAKYLDEMMAILPKSIAHKGRDGQDYEVPSYHREALKNIEGNLQEFNDMQDEEMKMDEITQINGDKREVQEQNALNRTRNTALNQSLPSQHNDERIPLRCLFEAVKIVEANANQTDLNEITFNPRLQVDNDKTVTEVFSEEEDVQMQDVSFQPKEQKSYGK